MDAIVTQKPQKHFLTSGEVAKLLGCSTYWVDTLIAKGQLDTHRIGNRGWHRVSIAALEKYAESHQIKLDWSLLSGQ